MMNAALKQEPLAPIIQDIMRKLRLADQQRKIGALLPSAGEEEGRKRAGEKEEETKRRQKEKEGEEEEELRCEGRDDTESLLICFVSYVLSHVMSVSLMITVTF